MIFCHVRHISSTPCAQIFISASCRLIVAVVSGANGANKWCSLIPLLCFLPTLNRALDFFNSLVSGLLAFFLSYSLFDRLLSQLLYLLQQELLTLPFATPGLLNLLERALTVGFCYYHYHGIKIMTEQFIETSFWFQLKDESERARGSSASFPTHPLLLSFIVIITTTTTMIIIIP